MPSQYSKLFKSYNSAILTMVAFSAEARVCAITAQANPYFVRAFEGGGADCVVCTKSDELEGSSADRTFAMLDSIDRGDPEKGLIAIECKNISPRTDQEANILWTFVLTEYQRRYCQLVILTSARDPDFVVGLPMRYIDLKFPNRRGDTEITFYGLRALWTLHSVPAFPPELAPFTLPLVRLGDALAQVRDFANGVQESW